MVAALGFSPGPSPSSMSLKEERTGPASAPLLLCFAGRAAPFQPGLSTLRSAVPHSALRALGSLSRSGLLRWSWYSICQRLHGFASPQYAQQRAGFLLSLLTPGLALVWVDPAAFSLLRAFSTLPERWRGACWGRGKGFILLPLARRMASLSRLELQTDGPLYSVMILPGQHH